MTAPPPLTVVVYGLDNPVLTERAMMFLRRHSDPALSRLVLVDNGSPIPYQAWGADQLMRWPTNQGANAVHHRLVQEGLIAPSPYVAFLHCDLFIRESGWDARVLDAFQTMPQLALLGFVGSPQMDAEGGRGTGTRLNFVGDRYEGIAKPGTPAEAHGTRLTGLMPAAILDHCALITTAAALAHLPRGAGHEGPRHHCECLWCCEVLARGERVAVLGIACDHLGGGIGTREGLASSERLAAAWLAEQGIGWAAGQSLPTMARETHRRFLAQVGRFIPLTVGADWTVTHAGA
jgi:hypothetical protein